MRLYLLAHLLNTYSHTCAVVTICSSAPTQTNVERAGAELPSAVAWVAESQLREEARSTGLRGAGRLHEGPTMAPSSIVLSRRKAILVGEKGVVPPVTPRPSS